MPTAEIEQPTGFAVSPQSQAEQTNTLWSIADGVGPQSLAAVFQMVMLPERAGCTAARIGKNYAATGWGSVFAG